MSLRLLVELMDQEPGCGTHLPGYRPPPPLPGLPRPLPESVPSYDVRALITSATDAVRLNQLGHRIGGEVRPILFKAAEELYEKSGCKNYPAAELYQLILAHWPPPPPSQPVRLVESLSITYAAEVLSEGSHKLIETILEILAFLVIPMDGPPGTGDPSKKNKPIVQPPPPPPPPIER